MSSEGTQKPGDNPNTLNSVPRKNARPRTKNSSNGNSNQSMRLGWIDPLPQVDVIHPLGIEPNVESIPAGEIDLDFDLPEKIGQPFADTVESVGDRIQLQEDEKTRVQDAVVAMSYFKAARQLYSTMLDHEKSSNQPLKAVFYDETPIPSHMSGALGIIGHMDTKVGKVLIKDATVLFKRWVAQGLNTLYSGQKGSPYRYKGDKLVWADPDSFNMTKRLARERIADIVKRTYDIDVDGNTYTVSMPQLVDQDLQVYFDQINNQVPDADVLRSLVSGLMMTVQQYRNDDLPNGEGRDDFLRHLGLTYATGVYEIPNMRESFEEWIAVYTTELKWRVESIFKVGPPPAGSNGYGAQTVSTTDNTARWQFPLSDADVNIGYLFSPSKGFTLTPRLVGYSRRKAVDGAAAFAQADSRKFYSD